MIDRYPEIVGIVSARDVVMKVAQKSMDRKNTTISMIMTLKPEELSETVSIGQAFNKFSLGQFRHLPVRRQDGSIALLTTTDLLFYIYDKAHEPKERRQVDQSSRR